MIEVEVSGFTEGARMPSGGDVARIARMAFAAGGVTEGHAAIVAVGSQEIRRYNREHREKDEPTDVLSFPVDGATPDAVGPRELGDVFVCEEHCSDVIEAVVHGVLHLCGLDHETDQGQMLALQAEILRWERR